MVKTNRILGNLFLVILSGFIFNCSSVKKVAVKPNEHMEIGWTPKSVFQSPSYASWFDTTYTNYAMNEEYITQLKKMRMDSVKILIVYATWCGDSKTQMPRFFKIMDTVNFPQDHITLVAVDRTMEIPPGIKKEYGITNVPTFMVIYKGIEIGRIIESPKTTLEEDLTGLLIPLLSQ